MAQPSVQQPMLSPPLSPSANRVASIVGDLGGAASSLAANGHPSTSSNHMQQVKKAHKEPNGHHKQHHQSRPSSSRAQSGVSHSNAQHHASSTDVSGEVSTKGVEAAKDPTVANAPGASFSVATKPQDRDPSLLRQPPKSKGFDNLSSYALDPYGRIPANDYNYRQRDRLVASAQESAIESGNMHWVALMDLAHLASQHHMSPYSIMKFGPRGSPFAYIPITLQQPEVVDKTMVKQREEELQAKQWLISKRHRRLVLGAATPMDSDDDLPVLSLSHLKASQPSTPNGLHSSVGTKRPASLTTPPDTRARSVLRTEKEEDRQQVERDLNEAMTDSIDVNSSRSSPEDVLPPPSREASSSDEDLVVTHGKSADQVDLSTFDRSTRMVELNNNSSSSTSTQAEANGSDGDVADELMTSSQAGSSVEVGGPMDKERTMAQEMEEASATRKPAHPGTSASKEDAMGPLSHSSSDANAKKDDAMKNENPQQNSNSNGDDSWLSQAELRRIEQQKAALATKTSDTHPIHISPILPDDLLASVGKKVRQVAEPQMLKLDSLSSATKQVTAASEGYFRDHASEQIRGKRLIRLRGMLDLTSITATDPSACYLSQSQLAEQAAKENTVSLTSSADAVGKDGLGTSNSANEGSPMIGNLLLSSCPGKKVRLSGPVRGRGAICRDLGLDLTRIYSIGVRAVVCCLNDEELSFLGAPWSEYEAEADRLGLDIYRLPMAEGFAPTNVEDMDAAMTSIVGDCTMNGTNVLVHCRGGVGRAGLIACSWLLKMGFVGERSSKNLNGIDGLVDVKGLAGESRAQIVHRTTSETSHDAITGNQQQDEEEEEEECEEIIDTVRSLIETIRRRRSPKAIETAEQVKFLVDYVTFLHRQERLKGQLLQQQQ